MLFCPMGTLPTHLIISGSWIRAACSTCMLSITESDVLLYLILDDAGLLGDKPQIIQFLTPATAQCKALAQQFDLDPNALSISSTDPFDIMLNNLVNSKKVTPEQLAEALQSRLVGHGQLAGKILEYEFTK